MAKILAIDTNILIRYLRNDHPTLSSKARNLFAKAQDGKVIIYLDETIVAESIWLLINSFDTPREFIVSKFNELLSFDWTKNPRKKTLQMALSLFGQKKSLSYVDCWLYALSVTENLEMETFDKNLRQLKT